MSESVDDRVVWAYSLDGKGGATSIRLGDPLPEALSWYHIQCDHPLAPDTLIGLGVPEPVVETMVATETRPRAIEFEQGILVILRGVNTNPGADPEDLISLRIWLTEALIVTARKTDRRLLSAQDVRDQLQRGLGPRNVGEFFEAVTERLAFRIGNVVEDFEDELLNIERELENSRSQKLRPALVELRRKAAELRRYLAPQREALDVVFRMRKNFLDQYAFAVREQADRMTRYVEDLDLARERAQLLQEELRNRMADQQNQRMYILSLVTAIFLPLSFLTGVFGMNVAGLPGVENPRGFVFVFAFMLVVAVGTLTWMRYKKWM